MNKLLILSLIFFASINAQSQYFLGAGAAYKDYAQKYNKVTGVVPVITFGYSFNIVRLHIDINPETNIRVTQPKNKDKEYKKNAIGEFNFMADYTASLADKSKFYVGLGVGTVTIAETYLVHDDDYDKNFVNNKDKAVGFDKVKKEKTKNKTGVLAELGFVQTFGKCDLGLGLKRYLTNMDIKESIGLSADSGPSNTGKLSAGSGVTTAEIFAAYVF